MAARPGGRPAGVRLGSARRPGPNSQTVSSSPPHERGGRRDGRARASRLTERSFVDEVAVVAVVAVIGRVGKPAAATAEPAVHSVLTRCTVQCVDSASLVSEPACLAGQAKVVRKE